ncbi:hypothetical protein CEP54_016064 [Fusarium duplospermum]|uniref:Hydrophobin n=1 Tax=Fusarium duplospermum TaxID=1325734 RepID=A0A428NIL4_9HYPO|nr:hypothetical protein CEP54_016064 [Fusarium duplospermum]
MKPATLLALPALALAAATPAKVEERQIGLPLPLDPELPLDPTCVLAITGITSCVTNLDPTAPPTELLLGQLVGLATCSVGIVVRVVLCALPL